jgi:hypothetical protein
MTFAPRRPASLALALVLGALTGRAEAQVEIDPCVPPDGISTCVPADNLWPYVGGGRWFWQAPTDTAAELSASFGLALSYVRRPIGLRVASPDPDGTTLYAVENAFGMTVMAAVGVTERLQVQLEAPFTLIQDGATKADIVGSDDFLPRSAVGDFRFGTSFAIVRREKNADGPALAARFEMSAPTGQDEAFAGAPSAAYAPGMSFDYRVGRFSIGADAGARIRDDTVIAGVIIGTQITGGLGIGVDAVKDGWFSINAEAFALFSVLRGTEELVEDGKTVDKALPIHIPAEWLLSLRTAGALDGRFRASLGGGSFIPTADALPVTTPTFRVVAGIHYLHD